MLQAYAYAIHLLASFALLGVFLVIYVWATPFNEVALMRDGNVAAALSLSGAMLGFTLPVASSLVHNDSFPTFLFWALGAMAVQVATYAVVSRALPNMREAIIANNAAMGGFMGAVSLAVGILNAACLS